MPTFRPVTLGSPKKDGTINIKICIIHNSQSAYIKTKHYIAPEYLVNGKIDDDHPNHRHLNVDLSEKVAKYQRTLLKLDDKVVDQMTALQIKNYVLNERQTDALYFFQYAETRIQELKEMGKKTWEVYNSSILAFRKFTVRDVTFQEIDKRMLEKFEYWLRNKGNKGEKDENDKVIRNCTTNTISVYMRSLRTIFRSAMDEFNQEGYEPVIFNYPFRYYKIKNEDTEKRNLSIDEIKKIRDYTPANIYEEIARDMFMLTFYLIGINMVDLFNCKGLDKGRLKYTRTKTATKRPTNFSIKIEPEAKLILDKYKGEKCLLKFADPIDRTSFKKYQRVKFCYQNHHEFLKMVNKTLKDVAKNVGCDQEITTYYARHSWATIASNDCGIHDDEIALCLGHTNPDRKTTLIYINKDIDKIDVINRKVLDAIK